MSLCGVTLVDGEVAFTRSGQAWLGLHIEPKSGEMLSKSQRISVALGLFQLIYSRVEEGMLVLQTHPLRTAEYVKTIMSRAPAEPALRAAYIDYTLDVEAALRERPSFTSSRYLFIRLKGATPDNWRDAARRVRERVERTFGIAETQFTAKRLSVLRTEAGEMERHAASCLKVRPFKTDDWHVYIEQQFRRGAAPRVAEDGVLGVKQKDGELIAVSSRLAEAQNCIVREEARHVELMHEDELESAQAFMCVSRLPEGEYPSSNGGWLYRLLWAGIPCDCVVRFKRREAREFLGDLRKRKVRADDQIDQLQKVGHEVPSDLEDAAAEARAIEAATKKTKAPGIEFSTTFALYGATAEQVRESVAQLKAFYETDQFELARPIGEQARLMRGFFPGGDDVPIDYVKRAAPTYIAASELHMTHEVGTRGGIYVGRVIWAPSGAPYLGHGTVVSLDASEAERDWSPAMAITGTPGGGKTATTKACLLYPSLLRGTRAIIFDPKQSEYSSLLSIPGMEGRIAHVRPDRTANVSFDPLVLIGHRDTKESVASSFLQMLIGATPESDEALVIDNAVTWAIENDSRMLAVVEWLGRQRSETAKRVAEHLRRYARAPLAHLAFGENTIDVGRQVTIFDLEALNLPSREDLIQGTRLTREQHLSVCTFYLMAAFGVEFARTNDPASPAQIVVDEAHILTVFAQGRTLISKAIRTGRSQSVQIILASQSANDFVDLLSHVPTRLAFKQEDVSPSELSAAAKFVCGHESPEVMDTIGSLGKGQFILRDHRGRIGLVQAELASELQQELAKNPTVERALGQETAA